MRVRVRCQGEGAGDSCLFKLNSPSHPHPHPQDWVESTLMMKKDPKEKRQLKYAHYFMNTYVICCWVWLFGYVYYVATIPRTFVLDLFLKCVGHFLSYASAVIIMWLTNSIVDEMRHAILLKLSFKHKDLVVDEIPVQTIVKYH